MAQSDFQSAFFTYYVVNSFRCQCVNEYTHSYAVECSSGMVTAPDFPKEPASTLVNGISSWLLNVALEKCVGSLCVYVCSRASLKAMVKTTDLTPRALHRLIYLLVIPKDKGTAIPILQTRKLTQG